MTKKSNYTLRSKCCNGKVKTQGKTTMYYVCLKCKEACDVIFVERKTWTRNPATQVQGDKREKRKRLFTDKEIREFLKHEDF